jgi:hypothetical protein
LGGKKLVRLQFDMRFFALHLGLLLRISRFWEVQQVVIVVSISPRLGGKPLGYAGVGCAAFWGQLFMVFKIPKLDHTLQ